MPTCDPRDSLAVAGGGSSAPRRMLGSRRGRRRFCSVAADTRAALGGSRDTVA